jgi:tetratricopeptide (TPR) repeat protein
LEQLVSSLEAREELASAKGVWALASLGNVFRRSGSLYFPRAQKHLEQADELARDLRKTTWVDPVLGRIQYDLGYIAFLRNDFSEAMAHLDLAMASHKKTRQAVGFRIAKSVTELAKAREARYYDTSGLSENLAAFADLEGADARRWVTNCHVHLAEFSFVCQEYDQALDHLVAAERNLDCLGLRTGRGKLLQLRGACHMNIGENEKALYVLSASLARYQELRTSEGFAEVCYTYGKALERQGLASEALIIYRLGCSADPGMDNTFRRRSCLSAARRLKKR